MTINDLFITIDSFGQECPANWEEIADCLNDEIREMIDTELKADPTADINDLRDKADTIWERYWAGDIPWAPQPTTGEIVARRRHGDAKTHLTLTAKAEAFYTGTSPFDIYELDTDDGRHLYTYVYPGGKETEPMTEEELNEALEGMAPTYDVYTDVPGLDRTDIDFYEDAREIAQAFAAQGHTVEIRDHETGDTVELFNEEDEDDE